MNKNKQIKHLNLCLTARDGNREGSIITMRRCNNRDQNQVWRDQALLYFREIKFFIVGLNKWPWLNCVSKNKTNLYRPCAITNANYLAMINILFFFFSDSTTITTSYGSIHPTSASTALKALPAVSSYFVATAAWHNIGSSLWA